MEVLFKWSDQSCTPSATPDGQICSILDHCMDYDIPPGKFFTDITNYLPHIKKFKLMNHLGTGGLELFKVNV